MTWARLTLAALFSASHLYALLFTRLHPTRYIPTEFALTVASADDHRPGVLDRRPSVTLRGLSTAIVSTTVRSGDDLLDLHQDERSIDDPLGHRTSVLGPRPNVSRFAQPMTFTLTAVR